MFADRSLPDYELLFQEHGSPVWQEDEARSVYSPGAYLTELLDLLDELFQQASLLDTDRRPDLAEIPFDAEHTFTPTSYLGIVNKVLERLAGPDPYGELERAEHPLTLPFALHETRVAAYLRRLGVTPEELYRLFTPEPDPDVLARVCLGLTGQEARLITTPAADGPGFAARYGLGDKEGPAALEDVERFLAATGLTGPELRDLVDAGEADLSEDGRALVWGARREHVPTAWFELVNRVVRLARKAGVAPADVAGIVTSCCEGRLDRPALRVIAVVLRLQHDYGLPVADVCALAAPAAAVAFPPFTGDLLAPQSRDALRLLSRAIDVSERDITDTVLRYRARYAELEPSPFDRGGPREPVVALLRRVGLYTAALGLSAGELFDLLEVLESDPSLWRHTAYAVMVRAGVQDCYRIVEGAAPADGLWLAQTLHAVTRWAAGAGLAVTDLKDVLGGEAAGHGGMAQVLDGLGRRFAPVAMAPGLFAGQRFGPRASRVIHDVLTGHGHGDGAENGNGCEGGNGPGDGVVSARDGRLLRLDADRVAAAAYDAVTALATPVKDDFLGIGLGERPAGKIFANLVLAGHLEPGGALVTPLPGSLRPATRHDALAGPLFSLIGTLLDGSTAVYPSDLAAVGGDLTEAELAELYDNLVYHGYLEPGGEVRDPAFFADETNLAFFTVDADFGDVAPRVLAVLAERVERFRAARPELDRGIFAGLRPDPDELVDSLRFNGYVDADGRYTDVAALAGQPLAGFGLALEFHPYRKAVLEAMQEQIAAFRAELYTFAPADFVPLADDVMAGLAAEAVAEAGPGGEPVLPAVFSPEEAGAVTARLAEIAEDGRPYRIDRRALAELGFTEDELPLLVGRLVTAGHLDGRLAVPRELLGYFRTVTNALEFTLPALEDYERDLFFLLHAVAAETATAISEIAATLEQRARAQRQTLYDALADAFGVPAATAEAVCAAVTGSAQETLDALVAPALAGAREDADPRLRQTYRRIRSFALLAARLGLDATEVTAVFHDQDLTGKYPEPLALPPGVDRFDALLESADGSIYAFTGRRYLVYSAATQALESPRARPLAELSPRLAGLDGVDAAFALPDGAEWIVGRTAAGASKVFAREPGGTRWAEREQVWGRVRNTFDDPKRIDAAFVDEDGRTYLFCGDQYVRYSSSRYAAVDEGYPRGIHEWWEREGHGTPLPAPFRRSLDAVFQDTDGRVHLFAGHGYLTAGKDPQPVEEKWGRVRNAFERAPRLDAAYVDAEGRVCLLARDQLVRYTDSVENDGVCVDDGYPRLLSALFPPGFTSDVDAAFVDRSGVLHVFKDGRTVAGSGAPEPTAERWGALAPALPGGRVDAAFTGLDGNTYLFSGETYLRYSGADYSVVDLGYPRVIAGDWGGLRRVAASFVMDGRTYLFGTGGLLFELPLDQVPELEAGRLSPALRRRFQEHGLSLAEDAAPAAAASGGWTVPTEQGVTVRLAPDPASVKVHSDDSAFHVRYSGRDYTVPDAGFPRPLPDDWWNLPGGPARVDAVLTGRDGRTYLFLGGQYVVFDQRNRWWSEPRPLAEQWDSLPFTTVDAAFVGKDGRTYVFSGDQYVRYSGADYSRVDDRFPADVPAYWGNVVSNVARTGRVDAVLVMDVTETVNGAETTRACTYVFSGDQFLRFEGTAPGTPQPGYPRALADLAEEPRFGALPVTLDGVDAAYADRRNVYLFRGGDCYVVSDTLYRRYDHLDLPGLGCAFLEDGSLMVERRGGWHRHSAVEATEATSAPARPRTLHAAPATWRDGLDAVLEGADGNTYLFKGPMCLSTRLNREYPLAAEWGLPRNTVQQDNTVDAAFTGRDGRTYLFSGDQFVVYSPGDQDTIEGDPLPVAEHWGGLSGVALAYVRGEETYLFERPSADGTVRYLLHTGDDYRLPGTLMVTDASFWDVPAGYRPAGALLPDAVLAEGENLFLLDGERCVRLDETTGEWSYPRPAARIWAGLTVEPGDRLRTAFTAADGSVCFFFQHRWTRYAGGSCSPLTMIRDTWGRSRNPFVAGDGTAQVDAAFVDTASTNAGERTFLFSGDRYVRYTGSEYRYIDPGYPKKIVGNLRREEAFANLPEAFDDAVADRIAGGARKVIDAVVGNRRTAYVFTGGAVHAVSRARAAASDLDGCGRVRNELAARRRVDATLVRGEHTYLFAADQYVRYTGTAYDYVDDGYPRAIGDGTGDPDGGLAGELGLPPLPPAFAAGLDAAFHGPGDHTYLFKGEQSLREGTLAPIAGTWGTVDNAFDATPQAIDAAFVAPTGDLYAFRTGQYVRYLPGRLEEVAEGYPRTVQDDWGDLPGTFEEGPDAAFVLRGRTYLVKGDAYVRYSDPSCGTPDRTFPQPFRNRWSESADYRLSDVHTIVRFTDLARSRRDGLAAFLTGPVEDPYLRLAELFGWDPGEVAWARRNAHLLTIRTAEEDRFEIEFLLRLAEAFAVTRRMGSTPSAVHAEIVSRPAAQAADHLHALLERPRTEEEWAALSERVDGELEVLKRDALVALCLRRAGALTSRDLYERFLIDVDMGAEGRTSPVREAIAATQLYLHRYLLDLEDVRVRAGEDPAGVRERVRARWAWLRNYRLWEANRKVFLYPENYVRPELRQDKTPAFEALEDDLLRNEITEEGALRAYKRYLDEYTEVSRLAVAGGYVYVPDPGEPDLRRLVLFGRTRTEPRRHYYRQAEFRDGERLSTTWRPWREVGVQIEADRVYPVHAFARVFAFWAVAESVAPEDPAHAPAGTNPEPVYQVKISFSFLNLNQDWVPAQQLPAGDRHNQPISNVSLYVQAAASVPGGGDHDSIVVTCSYRSGGADHRYAFVLTPELYAVRLAEPPVPPDPSYVTRIFDEPVAEAGVVPFNMPAETQDAPWMSVDHKGGSFLCRPIVPAVDENGLMTLRGNRDRLPTTWSRIDAAVTLPGGARYFFDNTEHRFISTPAGAESTGQRGRRISDHWGLVSHPMYDRERVDAALARPGENLLFCDGSYYVHTGDPFGPAPRPKPLAGNADTLPSAWERVDAAFTGPDGREYFFSHQKDGTQYVRGPSFGSPRPIRERWSLPDDVRTVDTAFTLNGHLYMIFGERYTRFTGDHDGRSPQRPDGEYPRKLSENQEGLPTSGTVRACLPYGDGAYFFTAAKTYTYLGGAERAGGDIKDLARIGTAITADGAVDAAWAVPGADGTHLLYLTRGEELVRYTVTSGWTGPGTIDEGYPKPLPAPVKAVFARGGTRHVFGEGTYATLPSATAEPDLSLALTPIAGDWGGLPAGFGTSFTGAMDDGGRLFLFLTVGGGTGGAKPEGWYTASAERPYAYATLLHQIVRLTSSTAYKLNRELLTAGVAGLLAPETQETDELPRFSGEESGPTTIKVTAQVPERSRPTSSHLDFQSANGLYNWEIFFHAPMLIAGALNQAQRFDEARRWHEYVFDPTQPVRYWRFLPFLAGDLSALTESCRTDLRRLEAAGVDVTAVRAALDEKLAGLDRLAPAFLHARELDDGDEDFLADLEGGGLAGALQALAGLPALADGLRERVAMMAGLRRQYELMSDRDALLRAYQEDPFHPHAIAALRPAAYRRAVVMAYVDNLLDWGDLLFRQYTAESVDEARMLYVFAHDLLGERPEPLGPRALPAALSYRELTAGGEGAQAELTAGGALLRGGGQVHSGVESTYFHVPANGVFLDYWTRVEDRLRKIRQSLDIMGVARPLPLFEPPLDVDALVADVAGGASLDRVAATGPAVTPQHRFSFLFRRAQELADRLRQLGNDLLGVLERHDSEELALLQNRQEGVILGLTRAIREAEVTIAAEQLAELQAGREGAAERAEHFQRLIDQGVTPLQAAQLEAMERGADAQFIGAALKIGSGIALALPQVTVGPFIIGTEHGGIEVSEALDRGAEVASLGGEGYSLLGELLGVRAEQERMEEDWRFQLATARNDMAVLDHQVKTGEIQLANARRELALADRQIAHLDAVTTFMKEKFTGSELYGWMAGRISGLYYQSYTLAYELARSAQRAYHYEKGAAEEIIRPAYWESRRNGLLAGDALALDLDRLGRAYLDRDGRGLEIIKRVSLLRLDPLALLTFLDEGRCEFALTEALFDRDFPGHYRRRIKTVSVTFEGEQGPVGMNATLTQLDGKTVLAPDVRAVKHLLDPKGSPPDTLRGEWRPGQQIALSDLEQYKDNNGLFELRFDDDRYLPFEGTGAVSRWRLELPGRRTEGLTDVTIVVKYTAEQGGEVFANAVRGLLKPYQTARYFDVAAAFPKEWELFTGGADDVLRLPFAPEQFPGMRSRQISAVHATYALADGGAARFLLGGDRRLALDQGTTLRTPGLTVGGREWELVLDGDRRALLGLGLVLVYRAETG
ncbi:hemopexin repeat-containing protein [Nonomuraea sp. NPDC050783]|uniref:Tc toxin subunit A-related protein n=1 Tax=Nonomuraea sp. NPDC050783 TaxID=3154634 RepID=UPI0034652CF7